MRISRPASARLVLCRPTDATLAQPRGHQPFGGQNRKSDECSVICFGMVRSSDPEIGADKQRMEKENWRGKANGTIESLSASATHRLNRRITTGPRDRE